MIQVHGLGEIFYEEKLVSNICGITGLLKTDKYY
jgi:hypothetical protein